MSKLASLLTALILAAAPVLAEPLRVLTHETRPFFYRADSGEPAGLEYDILDYYAKAAGRTLEVRFVDTWAEILPMIERGEADVAAANVTITPERQEVFDFSAVYLPIRVMLVEPRAHTTEALSELAGATLATMRGTTYEEILSAIPDARFHYVESDEGQLEAVASGDARAAAVDSAVAFSHLPTYPGLHMTLSLSDEQGFGFVVPKGSPLAEELTHHLSQLKRSRIYFRLLEKHLGSEAAQIVAAARE